MKADLVFVYGTLRKGARNHYVLAEANYANYKDIFVTNPKYTLLDLNGFPGAVPGKHQIIGEVFEVSDHMLKRLDEFERYPELYSREIIPTPWGNAWIYLYKQAQGDELVIESGDWLEYQKTVELFA